MSVPTPKRQSRSDRTDAPSVPASLRRKEAKLRGLYAYRLQAEIYRGGRLWPASISSTLLGMGDRTRSSREALAVLRPGRVGATTAREGRDAPRSGSDGGAGGARARPRRVASARADLHRRLIGMGLMTSLPDHASDFEDPDDQPITLPGEPLSETIIRERG